METEESGLIEKARCAADTSNWCSYVEAQGGALARRSEMPIRIAVWEEYESDTGALEHPPVGRYGDSINGRIFGIVCKGVHYVTRFYKWTVSWTKAKPHQNLGETETRTGFDLLKRGVLPARQSTGLSIRDQQQPYEFGLLDVLSGVAIATPLEFCQ